MKNLLLFLIAIFVLATSDTKAQTNVFSFDSIFARNKVNFDSIVRRKTDYKLQILYTRIDRDSTGFPHLTTYSYDADKYYYYCASMVKLPACALAMEKLRDLAPSGVSMFDSLAVDSMYAGCTTLASMMLSRPYSFPAQYIKEMLLLSNNQAFNPIYDLLGQEYFQDRLHQLGCGSAVIANRFAACDSDQNRINNPISLYGRTTHHYTYLKPGSTNARKQFYQGPFSTLVGKGFLVDTGIIYKPKDFRNSNYIALTDLHKFLTRLIFPQTQPEGERLRLAPEDYNYLHKCMGLFPRECAYPAYAVNKYPDHYMKFFMKQDSTQPYAPWHLRVFNKVGQAYGFVTDCSYVSDITDSVEFFLSCAMYLNADSILNDGIYEYDQIGYPFMNNLFNAIYYDEVHRHKANKTCFAWPDFSDTIVIKPSWFFIDSTNSMKAMEAVLCQLADSIKTEIGPSKQEMIIRFSANLGVILRQRSAYRYRFAELAKRINILTSPDRKLRVFITNEWNHPKSDLGGVYIQHRGWKKSLYNGDDFIMQ